MKIFQNTIIFNVSLSVCLAIFVSSFERISNEKKIEVTQFRLCAVIMCEAWKKRNNITSIKYPESINGFLITAKSLKVLRVLEFVFHKFWISHLYFIHKVEIIRHLFFARHSNSIANAFCSNTRRQFQSHTFVCYNVKDVRGHRFCQAVNNKISF